MARITFPSDDDFTPKNIRRIPLPVGFIADVLPLAAVTNDPRCASLICSQTGSGKSSFILKCIQERAAEDPGFRALVVSNRIATSVQQKNLFFDAVDVEGKKNLTPAGIRNTAEIGPCTVLTYQSLAQRLKREDAQNWAIGYQSVFFDEAHFFCADSLFNTDTDVLFMLPKLFRHASRLYFTATPWAVLPLLAEAEEPPPPQMLDRYQRVTGLPQSLEAILRVPPELRVYEQPQDFSAFDVCFFNQINELIPLIKKTPDERWLIFVSSKTRGRQLKDALGDCAIYMDADAKESATWQGIIDTERFEAQVLIATSVFDSGLNLKDKTLRNIALTTTDRVEFFQELGRKRRVEGERVNLFIQAPGPATVQRRLNEITEKLDQTYDCEPNVGHTSATYHRLRWELLRSRDNSLRDLFYLDGKEYLRARKTAQHTLERKKAWFTKLLRQMEREGENAFPQIVFSWLGQPDVRIRWVQDAVLDPLHDELSGFLERHLNSAITGDEERNSFSKELLALMLPLLPKNERKDRALKIEALNRRIRTLELPFELTSLSDGSWILSRRFVSVEPDLDNPPPVPES